MPSRSRIVLLTGAAGGIGRVMTRALLGGGHCVAAVDRHAASLERLKSLCDRTERLCPILADLSTEAGCAHAIEIARESFGTIEALVNNAGIGMSAIRPDAEVSHPGIEELTPEIWDRFFAIFVRAPVGRLTASGRGCEACEPPYRLARAGGGRSLAHGLKRDCL
jgi:NAD(P)-dependent dehydrogenase (short-subunit alcohol dehydrogenase family)